jgi:hypothetical protein
VYISGQVVWFTRVAAWTVNQVQNHTLLGVTLFLPARRATVLAQPSSLLLREKISSLFRIWTKFDTDLVLRFTNFPNFIKLKKTILTQQQNFCPQL